MNKNLTEVVFILDRSGSMSGLEQDTIGGFNSLIKKQKKEEELKKQKEIERQKQEEKKKQARF